MRILACIGIGLALGFAASLVVCFTVGTIYAEQLHYLVPDDVTRTALTVADKVQGYD